MMVLHVSVDKFIILMKRAEKNQLNGHKKCFVLGKNDDDKLFISDGSFITLFFLDQSVSHRKLDISLFLDGNVLIFELTILVCWNYILNIPKKQVNQVIAY